ncbi:MAG TPA: type I-U CRISPR-associated helicase/endonuclease Cas3 [Bryobacteraceae bacterium]|nr:type I-U CRISPR-associated helicase/endonuclease Cas3 [Bryobacteraceae bacterium]
MASGTLDFAGRFYALTGNKPFPWQTALYDRFIAEDVPRSCDLPTGVGKTSVIAVWLIALAAGARVPRRLVYIVNRRTVVDQTTDEAIKLRDNAAKSGIGHLAISTLRGRFADNQEWSVDPSRPAIICGTVDMIGSRLLFSGYRIGFKSRPLHAGFLGQDALLVHDEAHLEPAFQKLIEAIESEQNRCKDLNKVRIMALSATGRDYGGNGRDDGNKLFGLTEEEKQPPEVIPDPPTEPIHHLWRRLKAEKSLRLHEAKSEVVAERVAELASAHEGSGAAVLIYVMSLDDVATIERELKRTKRRIVLLAGTMRGKERDDLVEKAEFRRFLKGAEPGETVYLICTSAGEVGIDISASHMICDLSSFESMAQRLGRVHRYGEPIGHVARIDVVHPASFGKIDKKTGELKADELDIRRSKTLEILRQLPSMEDGVHDASPKALGDLRERSDLPYKIEDAFAPEPTILPATDILFDAWALTSIRQRMPGRQPVEPYLHGIAAWQPPETHVAWRQEVEIITGGLLDRYPPEDLLENYPLKPRELLRDRSDRVFTQLALLAKRHPEKPVWAIDDRGAVETTTLEQLADKEWKDRIEGCTVLLPPSAGGLNGGLLDGASEEADDVADITSASATSRIRVWSDDPEYESKTADLRRVRSIEVSTFEDDGAEPRFWEWFESFPIEGGSTAKGKVRWETHVSDVVCRTKQIVAGLTLPPGVADAVILAAKLHDHGKRWERFQITLGNLDYPNVLLAKSGPRGARLSEPFRHEFASVLDAQADPELNRLTGELKDMVLHLIAAHHGRARPHFGIDEAFDPERPFCETQALADETPRRFARLQRKYGRWGLAYLESLLRAADWAASAEPSEFVTGTKEVLR